MAILVSDWPALVRPVMQWVVSISATILTVWLVTLFIICMDGVSEDQCFMKLYSLRKYMTEQVVKNELLTFRRIYHLWPYLQSLWHPTSFSYKVNMTFLSTNMFTSTYLTRKKNSLKPLKVVLWGQDWWTFRCRQLWCRYSYISYVKEFHHY